MLLNINKTNKLSSYANNDYELEQNIIHSRNNKFQSFANNNYQIEQNINYSRNDLDKTELDDTDDEEGYF